MAGTDQNNQVAEEIYQQWMALEFDRVEQIKYQVLLQYPNATNPNQFQVVNGNGDVVFDAPTAKLEPSLTDDERQPGIVRPFNSYSGIGNVKVCSIYRQSYAHTCTVCNVHAVTNG